MTRDADERLQPGLLDRLTADPGGGPGRSTSRKALREALLRDLDDLFRTTPALDATWLRDPMLAGSVLNYGLPPLGGQEASGIEPGRLETTIRETLQRFEPRLERKSIRVQVLEPTERMHTHNVIELQIRGTLRSGKVEQEVLLRTRVNVATREVQWQG